MAKKSSRPDTPLANTPEPKMVTIGRLKEVRDSLQKSANYKNAALKQIVPTVGYEDKGVQSLLSSQSSDKKSADKYSKIIAKNKK